MYGGSRGDYRGRGRDAGGRGFGRGGGHSGAPWGVQQRSVEHGVPMIRKGSVVVNQLEININNKNLMVYKYRVDVTAVLVTKSGEKLIDCAKCSKIPFMENRTRSALNSLLRTFLKKQMSQDLSFNFVYDMSSIIYGLDESLDGREQIFERSTIPQKHIPAFGGAKMTHVIMKFSKTLEFKLDPKSPNYAIDEVKQFLDILTSAMLIRNAEYNYVKGGYFHKGRAESHETDVNGSIVVRKGIEKSVQLIDLDGVFVLQFSILTKPFFRKQKAVDFLINYLGARDARDLESILSRNKCPKQCAGIHFLTTHTADPKVVFLRNFHERSAKETEIQDRDQSVEAYFLEKYNCQLDHPNLPLLIEKRSKNVSYYPLDVLEVDTLQRVTNSMLGRDQSKIVDFSRLSPIEHLNDLSNFIALLRLDSSNNYLNAFEISVAEKVQHIEASLLERPALHFGNQVLNSAPESNDFIYGRDLLYKRGATFPKTAVINAADMSEHDIERCLNLIATQAHKRGMTKTDNLNKAHIDTLCVDLHEEDMLRKLQSLKRRGVEFVILIASRANDPAHSILKYAEQNVGILTQHIGSETLRKLGGATIDNILLKTNQKLGGINYEIHANGLPGRLSELENFFVDTMFVGIELSHAGPQSVFDRVTKTAVLKPSTVGMCFTLSNATESRGTYWFQTPNKAIVENLGHGIKHALNNYSKIMRRMPKKILIFRGGVSAEFVQYVVDEEVHGPNGILEALQELKLAVDLYVVNVQVHCAIRVLRPENTENWKPVFANVPAGTCSIEGVTNPTLVDAVIVTQRGQIGTSRPTRLTLIYKSANAPNWNSEMLGWLGNALAYSHGVSACPTGIPSPLFGARNLAKRGADIVNFKMEDSDISIHSGGSEVAVDNFDVYERLSKDLAVKLSEFQFWA